jgi:hypothetical protein
MGATADCPRLLLEGVVDKFLSAFSTMSFVFFALIY